MNLGVRTILLIAALVLFLIAVFSDGNYFDLLALGLAALTGAFLSEAMGWSERTFTTSERRDTN